MSRRYYTKYVLYVETHAAKSHTDEEVQVDLYVLKRILQGVRMPFNLHRMQPLVEMEPIDGGDMKPVNRWYYWCKAYRKWKRDCAEWLETNSTWEKKWVSLKPHLMRKLSMGVS